jgi:hypothetical protein
LRNDAPTAQGAPEPGSWWQFSLPTERRLDFCQRLASIPPTDQRWLLMGLYVIQEGFTIRPLFGPQDDPAEARARIEELPEPAKVVADYRTCRLMMQWGFANGPYHLLRRQSLRLIPGADFREHRRFRRALARAASRT